MDGIGSGHDVWSSLVRISSGQNAALSVQFMFDGIKGKLARRGLRARPFQRALLVSIAGDGTYDAVRDGIAALGLPLSRLEQRRHQVEEIFRDDPQAGEPGQLSEMEAADAY